MYINFDLLFAKDLIPTDVLFLQALKQQKSEDISEYVATLLDDERYEFLLSKEYVHQIKGTSKMSEIERMRVTKKGNKLLEDIETADITDDDIIIRDWLVKMYSKMDKAIGNKKKIGTGIAQFRAHTGIDKNKLSYLLKTFLSDEDNMEWNHKLDKVFYSSKSVFATRFNIDECRLYEYYLKHKENFDLKFTTL